MTTEWKDLPTFQDVACAQADGWEIEFANSSSQEFAKWSGLAWHADRQFRARPRQPKMETVESRCWRGPLGQLQWWDSRTGLGEGFVRFPAGDIEGEVEV